MLLDVVKTGALLFLAAVVQVSVLSLVEIADATPDVVLVLLVLIALRRGPLVGAVAGFFGGLVLDTATFGTLGLTSLLLTLAGYWSGRFGEVTTRNSAQPPFVAVGLATIAVTLGGALLHFLLGEPIGAGRLVVDLLLPSLALNLLLTYPLYRLTRRFYGAPPARREVSPAV